MDFRTMLIEARNRQGFTLKKLSEAAGLSASTIHSYERGVTPTIDKADKLLRALGLTMTLGEGKEGS